MARTAIVIGGASGIGAAVVTRLRADGYDVTVADLAGEDGVLPVDVTSEESLAALFAGREALDLVVTTAGVSTLARIVDHDVAEWRRVVDVCLTGSFLVVKHAAGAVGSGGSIVLTSSLNATQPGGGLGAYCTAKAGVEQLTRVAALELAPRGVRVNAVAPGLVRTPLTAPAMDIAGIEEDYLANTPLGRSGAPSEIADAVAYLATAAWLTGEVLQLDGGAHLMRYPDLVAHVESAFS